MQRIHPTAVVDPAAKLADDVEVGPCAYIGPGVELGRGVSVGHHASVEGATSIGAATRVFPYAAVGGEPQDKKYRGEPTRLLIGRANTIREHVTIHVGSVGGDGCTRIGDDNLIMNCAHIAHDVQLGSHCIVASYCGLSGHVRVDDFAVLGAFTGVHQFVRVGESVMTAAKSGLSKDAPPFSLVGGFRARLVGMNSTGLRRRCFTAATSRALKRAYHLLFASRLIWAEARRRAAAEVGTVPEVARLLDFLVHSKRGVCR